MGARVERGGPTILVVMLGIAVFAIVCAILRGAITQAHFFWLILVLVVGTPTLLTSWFIGVPRLVPRLLGGSPRWQRRLLRWVARTPCPNPDVKLLARHNLAILAQDAGDHQEAEEQLRAILDRLAQLRHPEQEAEVRRRLADSLEALDRVNEAASERSRANDLVHGVGEQYEAIVAEAKALELQRRHAEAYALYQRSLDCLPPDRPVAEIQSLLYMSLSAFHAGRPSDALFWSSAIIEAYRDCANLSLAHRLAAVALSSLGRLDEAERQAQLAEEEAATDQDRAEALALRGSFQVRRGDLQAAERTAREADRLDPDHPRTRWSILAELARVRGEFREAIEILRRARAQVNEDQAGANRAMDSLLAFQLALIHCELGDGTEAASLLSQLESWRKDPKLSVLREAASAWLHALRGERDLAHSGMDAVEAKRREVVEDIATQRAALCYLARAARTLGEYEKAEPLLHGYLALDPDPVLLPDTYCSLAECRRKLGDSEGARSYDRKAASTRIGTLHERLARERLAAEAGEGEGSITAPSGVNPRPGTAG
ncbi:MAG: tetratricopeptide repeat protein [Isosphaeraceae bacterium]